MWPKIADDRFFYRTALEKVLFSIFQLLSQLGDVYAERGDRRQGGHHVEDQAQVGQRQEQAGYSWSAETRWIPTAASGNYNYNDLKKRSVDCTPCRHSF